MFRFVQKAAIPRATRRIFFPSRSRAVAATDTVAGCVVLGYSVTGPLVASGASLAPPRVCIALNRSVEDQPLVSTLDGPLIAAIAEDAR